MKQLEIKDTTHTNRAQSKRQLRNYASVLGKRSRGKSRELAQPPRSIATSV